ncbi:MAG: DUF4003 family protein [Erysipelotrichaceae bacterium]|nr:DUF4003 family protein [Erysipelotrichaceae bacterium]
MNEYIQNICEKFVDCRALLGECYKWSSTTDQCLRASFMLKDDTYVTESSIQEIKQFLKKREGIFSSLRSHIEMTLTVKMLQSGDYEEYYMKLKTVMEEFKMGWLFSDSYRVVTAMIIIENIAPEDFRHYIDKTKMIYEQMKRDHSWLTRDYDLIFAALLAVSDINVDDILLEMDESFRILKQEFRSSRNQELSHILSLNLNSPGEKTQRFLEIHDLLKRNRIRVSKSYHLEVLAVLSLLDMDDLSIVEQISQAEIYLNTYKPFRGWSMFQDERILYAIMLVIKANSHDSVLIDNVLLFVILRMQRSRDAAAAAAAAG